MAALLILIVFVAWVSTMPTSSVEPVRPAKKPERHNEVDKYKNRPYTSAKYLEDM